MSLVPWVNDYHRPHSHMDRSLGLWRHPEDSLQAVWPRNIFTSPLEDLRNLRSILQDTGATIDFDKGKFQANIDVQQFKPEEISVRVTGDNTVTIEGKHEETLDEHGYISRHFVRRYVLPENCDVQHVQSRLSSDGVLTIMAPKVVEGKEIEFKEIPVSRTGQPMKSIEKKKEAKKTEKKKV